MRSVTIKKLKDQLSYYLSKVKEGEVVLVADRDKVIAQITRPYLASTVAPDPLEQLLTDLASQGKATRATRRGFTPLPKDWEKVIAGISEEEFNKVMDEIRSDRE